jgi:hypothetical protein
MEGRNSAGTRFATPLEAYRVALQASHMADESSSFLPSYDGKQLEEWRGKHFPGAPPDQLEVRLWNWTMSPVCINLGSRRM